MSIGIEPVVKISNSSFSQKWKPYSAYKDSGVEWLGEIPEHWDIWKINHSFRCIGSGTTPSTNDMNFYKGDIPWTITSELRENIINDTVKKITHLALKEHSALELYPPGTLLIAMYGATIGRLGILGISACTNQACCAFSNPISLDIKFTFYWLLMRRQEIIVLSSGGGQPNINQEKLKEIRIPAPSLLEQRAIASFLDCETAHIDTLISKKESLISLLQEKRAALISHAVTYGLDSDVSMKDSGVEWFKCIPKHWNFSKIIRYADLKTGGTPKRENLRYWENGEINWITSGKVNKKKIFETEEKITKEGLTNSNANILPVNSVMIALNGQGKTKGTVAILKIESSCSQSLAAFVCDEINLHYNYLFYYLESKYKELRGLVGDSLRDGLSLGHLKSIYSPLPPPPEQHNIASFLDRETAHIDTLISKVREGIEMLREYRTALISAAVIGKIDVKEVV